MCLAGRNEPERSATRPQASTRSASPSRGGPHAHGWSGWDTLLVGGTGELIWFVAPVTVVVRDDQGNEETAPYRLSGVLERAADGRWLFRLFNGSEPVAVA